MLFGSLSSVQRTKADNKSESKEVQFPEGLFSVRTILVTILEWFSENRNSIWPKACLFVNPDIGQKNCQRLPV